ncbi:MAG: TraB/GumN family protein [Saprospiraceae bacterium]|nr:TraB/GumN family protein [Saprospiraceae bacterium]
MKNFVILIQLFLFQFSLAAQNILEKSLLWEISGKGIHEKSYLFGTIHLIPKEDFFLPEKFEKAFESTSTLYLELDMNEMTDIGKMMGIMEKCYMNNNKKLSDLLSEEEYSIVKEKMESMGLPMMLFERMKPLFISAMLSMESSNPFEGSSESTKSYELEFTQMANSKGKPVKGIETMEFQLSIFDSIPYDVQAKSLVHSLKSEKNKADDSMDSLIKLYKSQDINKLMSVIESSDEDMKPYMNLMLNNRNMSWIPIMEKAMIDKSCFFAVGAGHLGGEKGVIQLLRKQGFKVKAL